MIVLDLEFNSGMYGERLEEVLQIGAVRCEKLGGPVTDTFNVFIHPTIQKNLSPGARVLPELQSSEESGTDFPTALRAFTRWCGDEREFAEWGRDDFKILGKNGLYWGVDVAMPGEYCDVQAAFSRMVGETNMLQLYSAAEYCGIPDTFVFHNALNDAMYTCLVGGFIREDALRESVCQVTERDLRPLIKPRRPKKDQFRMGPFETIENALENLGSRRGVCPECGERARVREWYSAGEGTYYGQFNCQSHGVYIRRLQLIKQPDGRYWTYNDTLTPHAENLRKLRDAKRGERFDCGTGMGGKAKRRKMRLSKRP